MKSILTSVVASTFLSWQGLGRRTPQLILMCTDAAMSNGLKTDWGKLRFFRRAGGQDT